MSSATPALQSARRLLGTWLPGRAAKRVLERAIRAQGLRPSEVDEARMAELLIGPIYRELCHTVPAETLQRELGRFVISLRGSARPEGRTSAGATVGEAETNVAQDEGPPSDTAAGTSDAVDAASAGATSAEADTTVATGPARDTAPATEDDCLAIGARTDAADHTMAAVDTAGAAADTVGAAADTAGAAADTVGAAVAAAVLEPPPTHLQASAEPEPGVDLRIGPEDVRTPAADVSDGSWRTRLAAGLEGGHEAVLMALAILEGVDGAAVFSAVGHVVSTRGEVPDADALGRVIAAAGSLLERHGALRSVSVTTAAGTMVAVPVAPHWIALRGAPDLNLGAVYAALSALEEER